MNLPSSFVDRIRETTGDEFDRFLSSLDEAPPVSVRVNPFKKYNGFDLLENVVWATNAYYLPERISFTLDPHFHAGCYYVQEASSMYLEKVIRSCITSNGPVRVLDLCAAPGGKSTHLISIIPEGSLLVSNEVVPARNNTLRYNIEKWGHPNVVVTQSDPSVLGSLTGFFDVIVVDAPCSGEGLFRKDKEAVKEWSKEAVSACARRQSDILKDVLPALKQDGVLIYSTCTYEYEENERQISELISANGMELIELNPEDANIVKTDLGLRFYPHRIKGEGFFISALRKKAHEDSFSFSAKKQPQVKDRQWLSMLNETREDYTLFRKEDEMYAIPSAHYKDFQLLSEVAFVRKAGIHLGTLKGDDLVPAHDLAMSICLNPEIPRAELTSEEAVRYLRCDSITVSGITKGWAVVTYHGFALGWIKAIGSRVNNYFPKNQRILMSG